MLVLQSLLGRGCSSLPALQGKHILLFLPLFSSVERWARRALAAPRSHLPCSGGLWDVGGSTPRPSFLTCSPVIPPSRAPGCRGGPHFRSQLSAPRGVTASTKLTQARVFPSTRNSQDFCVSTSNQHRGRLLPAGGTAGNRCPPVIHRDVGGRRWGRRLGWSQTRANAALPWLQVSAGGSTRPPPHCTPTLHTAPSPTECPRLH